MEFSLDRHTIYLTLHGSHAYGMARPESDIDIRGVLICPKEYFHGYMKHFEQSSEPLKMDFNIDGITFLDKIQSMVGRKIVSGEKIDSVIYDIRKFCLLCSEANPNLLDILFADDSHHILKSTLMEPLLENRSLFLSTKVRWSYSGYAVAQLKKINSHRQYLLNPPKKKPIRADFGLPEHTVMPQDQLLAAESLITRKVEEWLGSREELSKDILYDMRQRIINAIKDIWSVLAADCYTWKSVDGELFLEQLHPPLTADGDIDDDAIQQSAGKLLGYDSNFLELLGMERGYRTQMAQWKQYNDWKINRNKERAALEEKFGMDCKHASHLVRLTKQAKEILETGKVIVRRPDAEELLAIRNGAWTYDQLIEWAQRQEREIDNFYKSGKSPLPKQPDRIAINKLCMDVVEKSFSIL